MKPSCGALESCVGEAMTLNALLLVLCGGFIAYVLWLGFWSSSAPWKNLDRD